MGSCKGSIPSLKHLSEHLEITKKLYTHLSKAIFKMVPINHFWWFLISVKPTPTLPILFKIYISKTASKRPTTLILS